MDEDLLQNRLARLTEAEISTRLQAQPFPGVEGVNEPLFPEDAGIPWRPASVLVGLFQGKNGWNLLYTRRTERVADHKGQVAFPGGAAEPADADSRATALREAYEEIGLLAQDVRILGQMGTLLTFSHFSITPVVGVLPWPYHFVPSAEEVSRVFSIPLIWLADPRHYTIKEYPHPVTRKHRPVIFFDAYDGELLWGISALITLAFVKILGLASVK